MSSTSRSGDERNVSLLAKDQYFREMKRIPRLSAEEEQRYLARMARGKTEQAKPQPDQWRLSLAQDARERLAEAYQPLVVHVARRYTRSCYRLELVDLIQEGNVGLLRALDATEHDDSCRFRSYAAACIQYTITNAIAEQDYLIPTSQRFHRRLLEAKQVEYHLRLEQGGEPPLADIATAMQIGEAQLRETYELARRQEVKSLHDLLEHYEDEIDEMVLRLMGSYEPAPGLSPERQAALRETLHEAIAGLSQRQRDILRWRYGLDDERPEECSVKEIAQRLGCHPSAVRTSEVRGCQHLAERLQVEPGPDGMQCRMREDAVRVAEVAWYTQQEVARLLGCTRETVREKMLAGELPTLRDARYPWLVYPKEAIDRLVAERQRQASLEQECYRWQEAIACLGCSRTTLERYVKAGKVPIIELGKEMGKRVVGYPRVAIDALAMQRQGQTRSWQAIK